MSVVQANQVLEDQSQIESYGGDTTFVGVMMAMAVLILLVTSVIISIYISACRAFAKALHYKEMEFEGARSKMMDASPVVVVEALLHINNQLHQHEAAVGILTYAQQDLDVQPKESW